MPLIPTHAPVWTTLAGLLNNLLWLVDVERIKLLEPGGSQWTTASVVSMTLHFSFVQLSWYEGTYTIEIIIAKGHCVYQIIVMLIWYSS